MITYFTIKNWAKYQHYKDRNPPWIKLHNSLMEDYEFDCLQDASKLLLIFIWLFASKLGEENPKIPNDSNWLKKKLPLKGQINLKPLINSGFLILGQGDSNALADRKQDAITEAEAEAETETETEGEGESDIATACFISELKTQVHPTHKKPDLKKWAKDIRLMREQDKRPDSEIRQMFEWVMVDEFWMGVCLSPSNLRKSWDKIQVQKDRKPVNGKSAEYEKEYERMKKAGDL